MLAEAATVEEVTPRILRAVGEWLIWDVGALWRIDRNGRHFVASRFGINHPKRSRNLKSACRERTFMPRGRVTGPGVVQVVSPLLHS